MSDHGHLSSYEGHKERRTGKIRGAFSRMHRALDGWMLARAPPLPAQVGLQHGTMDLGISILLIFVRYVALRNLDFFIKTGWMSGLLLTTLVVSRRQQSESTEAALDME